MSVTASKVVGRWRLTDSGDLWELPRTTAAVDEMLLVAVEAVATSF